MPRRKYSKALVDASNVAHFSDNAVGKVDSLESMRAKLEEEGYEPILVADASLRHKVDDADAYEKLVENGTIQQAPAGTDADYFILSFARELSAVVVSNDRFRDFIESFPELKRRLVRFMIVKGEVVLERRTKGRSANGQAAAKKQNGD